MDVIRDLRRVTKLCLLLNVATRLAVKTLADGRNAHISVHDFPRWKEKFSNYFVFPDDVERSEDEFTALLEPRNLESKNAH